jgi:CBS domain-containing protein
MSARRVKRLPVVSEDGHLVGVVSRMDVLSVFSREDYEIRDEIVNVIAGERALDRQAFDVEVRAGIVTVTGQAECKAVAVQLLDAIRHVEGVVDVRDRLSHPHDDAASKGNFAPFGAFPKG